MLRKLLLLVILSLTSLLKSQTLYWVGGSGYWNDISHWSYTSGGAPANIIPGSGSTVIFDNASGTSDITIHALHTVEVKSITSLNSSFNINVIGSPNVDLHLKGSAALNEYFYFNLNGKIVLEPQGPATFNFSHNKFNNDIYVNASSDVSLGVLSTKKSLNLSGNLTLKNSVLFANDLLITNARAEFANNTLQIANSIAMVNAQVQNTSAQKSNIICKKTSLAPAVLSALSNVGNLTVTPIAPQACNITLTSFSNPTCSGLCNGTAAFDLSGCTNPPYIIQWLNTDPSAACQTLPPAEGAFAGTTYSVNALCGCGTQYTVLFENNIGEQFAIQVSIINPAPTLLTFSSTLPACNSLCNGQIRVNVISGVVPLSVNWSPPVTTHTNIITRDTLKNACAGVYTLTTTNANGCLNTFTTTLSQPPLLLANGSSSSITCNGVCNGSATLSPTGGTAPYSFSWTPSATTSTIGGLCVGVVSGTVTDSKTCTATYTANITQPPAITLTVTKTNLICGSLCDGTASVTATGGSGAGYTYTWSSGGATGSSATGLCAGDYTVNVMDNLLCPKTITFSITAPPTLTTAPTQTNLVCSSICTGAINLHPSGGTGAYTYTWNPAVSTTSVANNLCSGPYTYTVEDNVGCITTNTINITQPPALTLTIASTSITCFGACNGTATGNVSGGTGAYSFTWTPGNPTGQGTNAITNLCPGVYTLIAQDANGCQITRTVSITQPPTVSANITTTSPTCNGLCNGTINAAPSGGTVPYTYTLQPSAGVPVTGNPPFTGLCAGSYTLLIGDNNGCTYTRTVTLTQPNPIILTLNSTPINCFNQCNGSISSVVSGGTPTYTFSWSSGGTGSTVNNQCVGVHTATVTDLNGCQATASVSITSPPDLTVTITPVNPNCNAQCTGIANASVAGGTPNYTINWNNGATGNVASNLCQGVYTATVTDFFGCIKTQTVAIVTPPPITLTPVNGTVSCAGSCDGTVSVIATGGTASYSYSWNAIPAQATPTATGLCVGNYIASVTDAQGCIASVAANVSQPAALTASISNIQSSCNVCIGSATANGLGGTPPYTYSWLPGGQTAQTPTDLCVGTQTVTVTDSKGCTTTQTLQITQTVLVLITANNNTLSCNNVCSGIATANASGGTGPGTYSFTWTPPSPGSVQNTQTATALCGGTHTVMVSDGNGCSSTNTITFTNPPAITLTVNQTNVRCNSLCNGSATATATGGTGSITYLWQPGGFTTSSISGLCAGVYTLTATDANHCSQTQIVTITETPSLTVSFTNNSPSTCVASDGSISFVPGGGQAPYSFTWTPGGSTTANPLINLGDGTYVLNLTDNNGCQTSFTTTLNDPTGPTVTATSNSIACFGSCTGSSTLSITGSGPFTVNWPSVPSTNTVVSGLCAGNYISQVTDVNGCVTNQTVNIAQPAQISSTGVMTNLSCNTICNGAINLTPSGGIAPYTFAWSPSGGNVEDPSNLCAGNYSVTITDANSCSITNTFVLTQPGPLALGFNKKDALCSGQCNGGVRAIVSGGTAPYSYTWTPSAPFAGSNLDTLVNICAGIYTITASDANGCIITGTVDIMQPVTLTSSVTAVNIKCNGQCNGSATLNASGGTAPYTYHYNASVTGQTISGLCVGTYTGIVNDANGCVSSLFFNITEPAPIVVTATVTNPKCNAVCDGSVSTTVTGGNPTYHYNWIPNGGPVSSPTGLCAGNYTVVVTDDSLCTGQALVTLVDPPLLISNLSFTNPTCNNGCNGVATANPIGGTNPITYSWVNPASSNQTITNLCAGSYTVTITDANNCQDVQTVTLTSPPAISVNPGITPATCGSSNGSIDAVAIGGLPNYTYNWLPPLSSTSQTVTGLAAGIYTVIVTDANSCSSVISIPLSNSNGPSGATINFTNTTCNGQCNGAAEISNPVGGTPSYTLNWISPASTNSLITNLCAGSYTAQVTDANNCILFQSATILQPQPIDDNEAITGAACLGVCSGSMIVNPTGGNGGYTYSWSNSANTQSITGLCPGTVSLTITDNMGCTLNASYTIPSVTAITSSTYATNNICSGNCNGTLLATNIAGGLPPYTYVWTDPLGQSTPQALGLCNGTYSVTIKDANGCFNVFPATITSPAPVTFTPTVTQPSCDQCNGAATVLPVGGTPTYSLTWSNNQSGNTATGLCAGVYMIEITDGNGCISTSNVVINSSSSITGETITSSDEICFAACDGSVSVTAIGGVAPVTYHWVHNNSTSQTLTGLCSGVYYCNMTDATGCTRTATVQINAAATLSVTAQVVQSLCSSPTGSIVASASGGTGTYTYNWLPAGSTASLTNLAPGSYTLTVTDGNSCSVTRVYAISTINGPVITHTSQNISCTALCDGNIGITVSGGTPGYTIAWSNGASTPNISGLCAGGYSVEVTDAAGCKAIRNVLVAGVTPLVFSSPDSDNPRCHDECNGAITTIPSGGSLPYSYSWSPAGSTTSTNASLCFGNYSVTVIDANGCTASESYTLINPPPMGLTATTIDATCNNAADGSADITIIGGSPVYTYTWSNSASTEDISNVLPGTYTVGITDGNGCMIDTFVTINSTIVVNAAAGNDTTFCQNGTLILNGSNSTNATSYQWIELPSGTIVSTAVTATLTPATGTTTYVLVAINGTCTDNDTILVTSNPLPNVDAGPMVNIPLLSSATIGGNPTAPTGSTFTWTPNQSLDNLNGSNPTTSTTITTIYTVTATDANGCTNSDTVTVFIYPEIRIPNGFSPNGDGKNDTWMIDFIYQFPDCEVEVYNRWGEQLFYSKGYAIPWNGQYKGKDLPVGTYYYIINLHHYAYPDAYTGPLTIFR